MFALFHRVIFIVVSFFCLAFFNIRAFSYCRNIHIQKPNRKLGLSLSLAANCLVFSFVLFCDLPVVLGFLVIYLAILLQLLTFFQGELVDFIFNSGTFMFHIMNVKMGVSSIFILIYGIPSYTAFKESGLYLFSASITILLLVASLEIFQRSIKPQMIQILMKNPSQLRFVTCSMMLINVYLLILSVSYNQNYSELSGIFLFSTALLLFGAFYTSFLHGIKMSVMMEYEVKSQQLERRLEESRDDIEELQTFAFTDTLTEVHNRRYGLDELDRLIKENLPFCLCFIDIDHLKYVNDTFGHMQGDRYILDVVRIVSDGCVQGETLCRLGGDEFMLLMPLVPFKAAQEKMIRMHRAITELPAVYHPSFSYGIVEVEAGTNLSVSQILRRADQEMYRFKQVSHAGRAVMASEEETSVK